MLVCLCLMVWQELLGAAVGAGGVGEAAGLRSCAPAVAAAVELGLDVKQRCLWGVAPGDAGRLRLRCCVVLR